MWLRHKFVQIWKTSLKRNNEKQVGSEEESHCIVMCAACSNWRTWLYTKHEKCSVKVLLIISLLTIMLCLLYRDWNSQTHFIKSFFTHYLFIKINWILLHTWEVIFVHINWYHKFCSNTAILEVLFLNDN